MPTYQYVCTSCGAKIEIVQSFSDDPLVTCDDCAGPLRKVYSPVGIVFKGSGFYRTDSRSSGTSEKTTTGAKKDSGTAAPSTSGNGSPSAGSAAAPAATKGESSGGSPAGGGSTPSKKAT